MFRAVGRKKRKAWLALLISQNLSCFGLSSRSKLALKAEKYLLVWNVFWQISDNKPGRCLQGCVQTGAGRIGKGKAEWVLISRVGTLPLKSQCYLVVNPTLCCPPAWITLLSCVSRNGSWGGILPCIPKGKVTCSEWGKERKVHVCFYSQTTSGNHSEAQGWLSNIYITKSEWLAACNS